MVRSFILRTPTGNVFMQETAYKSEDYFQQILATTADVLSGDRIDSNSPRRWLLVQREMPVPDNDRGTNRWSLDHLFLDQNGVPTLVEVKRSTDSRLRREFVGQLLEYAANAVVYWGLDVIQASLSAQCAGNGITVEDLLADSLGLDIADESSIEQFWRQIETNLQAGNVRLIYVADSIPHEVKRIIEFLNKQMKPAEVLGVEVRLYTGRDGYELLIPTLIGQTAEAQAIKSTSPAGKLKWDEDSFYTNMKDRFGESGEAVIEIVRNIVQWLHSKGIEAKFGGTGKDYGSMQANFKNGETLCRPFMIYGNGSVEIRFGYIKEARPFKSEEKRLELLRRLNRIPGANLPEDKLDSFPSIKIERLIQSTQLDRFLDVWDWYLSETLSETGET